MTSVYLLIAQKIIHVKLHSVHIFLMHCQSKCFHYSLVTKLKELHWIAHVLAKSDTFIPTPNTSRTQGRMQGAANAAPRNGSH